MKTILKILLAVLVVNAAFQAGRVYMKQYQFEDDVQQTALFAGPRPSPADLLNRVMEHAEVRGIPLSRENVDITIDRMGITITASYTEEVQLVPVLYRHTFNFAPSVNARSLNAP